jgi:hypothetical protein
MLDQQPAHRDVVRGAHGYQRRRPKGGNGDRTGIVRSTPDSKDRHVPLAEPATSGTPTGFTSLDSQTIIGRHFESDPAGAPRRYENPRDAYDDSIRHLGGPALDVGLARQAS